MRRHPRSLFKKIRVSLKCKETGCTLDYSREASSPSDVTYMLGSALKHSKDTKGHRVDFHVEGRPHVEVKNG